MDVRSDSNTEATKNEFVPAMNKLQALLAGITPEQLAGPLPHTRGDVDDTCKILGTMTEDMRRLCFVVSQLSQEQNAEIGELRDLLAGDDVDTDKERRHNEIIASMGARKLLHGIATQLLQHDVQTAFPLPDDTLCPGHLFSDGSFGVHEIPGGLESGLGLVISMIETIGGHRRDAH